MKKNLTPTAFEKLLDWLDDNRDGAAQEYENIRRRLIKMFTCRGCYEPEDVADTTIDRVASKIDSLQDFSGPRAPYFYSVGVNVLHEWIRTNRKTPQLPPPPSNDNANELEDRHSCLEECMRSLSSENRELVNQYYQQEKRAKIDRRKQLAEKLGMSLNALRIKAFRVRASLYDCVTACMRRKGYEIG